METSEDKNVLPIVGLGGSGHEWSSCAIYNNRITAISEERLCRKKYGVGADLLSAESRKACLNELGINSNEVENVIACSLVPKPFYYALRKKTKIINHHLAHAYSAFAASGFEKSAVMVADNSGSIVRGEKIGKTRTVETISLFQGGPNGIELIDQVVGEHKLDADSETAFYQPGETSNSLGHFYRSASLHLGFSFQASEGTFPVSEDGKTMGLAPYGDDRFVDKIGELIKILPDSRLVSISTDQMGRLFKDCLQNKSFETRASFAYAVQYNLEQILLHCAKYLYTRTGLENLCLAGGVALNSVANGVLLENSPFKRVFVVPAPSDDGVSLGCAYYGLHKIYNIPIKELPVLHTAYLGPEHNNTEVDAALKKYDFSSENNSKLIDIVVNALAEGLVVGWFQGSSEFGPRALGHRSILAAPFPSTMRDKLNNEIKHREWFRPYGPIVPVGKMAEYFDFKGTSPFMSFVCRVLRPELIPAATHVDGTARLQTIEKNMNPRLYRLLMDFGDYTGIYILINTSFNQAGEPIVETAEDAIRSAIRMNLDILVVNDRIVYLNKKQNR